MAGWLSFAAAYAASPMRYAGRGGGTAIIEIA
jgi:hypothetical protein